MDGTIRSNIKIGASVMVVQKQDQRTGKHSRDRSRILTNSPNHHRGISNAWVRLCIVGQIKY